MRDRASQRLGSTPLEWTSDGPGSNLVGGRVGGIRAVPGELYGGAIESCFARDLPKVVVLVRGEASADTIAESSFQAGCRSVNR